MSLVISDTTPLNYLILIGQVDILRLLFGRLIVPPAVIREMSHKKTPTAVAAWAQSLPDWVEVRSPSKDLHLDIGSGEDEAISLAVEIGAAALLVDDRKARAAASEYGVLTFGTLAVLDLADEAGLLDFEEAVARLKTTSFHAEQAILDLLLAKVQSRTKP